MKITLKAYPDADPEQVDENGYLRAAVEAWRTHGIYPPPVCGDAQDPRVVRAVREAQARALARGLTEQDLVERQREFMEDLARGFFGTAPTPPSETS